MGNRHLPFFRVQRFATVLMKFYIPLKSSMLRQALRKGAVLHYRQIPVTVIPVSPQR